MLANERWPFAHTLGFRFVEPALDVRRVEKQLFDFQVHAVT